MEQTVKIVNSIELGPVLIAVISLSACSTPYEIARTKREAVRQQATTLATKAAESPRIGEYVKRDGSLPDADPKCEITVQLLWGGSWKSGLIGSLPACLKRKDKPAAMPTQFMIFGEDARSRHSLCAGEHGTAKVPGKDEEQEIWYCDWNSRYWENMPFSIEVKSKEKKRPLSRDLQLIRILRNGELVYIWSGSANPDDSTVLISHKVINSDTLPHLADLDLRVVPVGISLDRSVINAKVTESRSRALDRLEVVGKTLITSSSFAGGQLKKIGQCLKWQVDLIAFYAKSIAQKGGTAPKDPLKSSGGCREILGGNGNFAQQAWAKIGGPNAKTFEGLYGDFKERRLGELSDLDKEVKNRVDAFTKEFGSAGDQLKEAVTKKLEELWKGSEEQKELLKLYESNMSFTTAVQAAVAKHSPSEIEQDDVIEYKEGATKKTKNVKRRDALWLVTRGTWSQISQLVSDADNLVNTALRTGDQLLGLHVRLRQDALRIAKSPEEQAANYLRIAKALEAKSDYFEARIENPELLEGELELGMELSDPLQLYLLAVWNTVVVNPKLVSETNIDLENLIPVIDLIGGRWNIGKMRYGEIRLGLGAMYFQDKTTDASGIVQEVFNGALQANLGIGFARIGAAYVLNKAEGPRTGLAKKGGRWRVLIGADLLKLITNEDAEFF